MNFGKKGLKLASVLMGTMLMGGVLAGCGSQADSNEIKVGANFEMTGNVATTVQQRSTASSSQSMRSTMRAASMARKSRWSRPTINPRHQRPSMRQRS